MPTSTQNPFDTIGKVVDVTREAFEAQVRLGADYADLAQLALKEGSNPIDAGSAYLASAWREAGNYWQAVADLNLQYATQVLKIGSHAAGLVIADVDAAIKKSRSAKATKAAPSSEASSRSARTQRATGRRKQS